MYIFGSFFEFFTCIFVYFHYSYNSSAFDVSADLQELSLTPVTVVCAGAKSILDIPKTLEYLVRYIFALLNTLFAFRKPIA